MGLWFQKVGAYDQTHGGRNWKLGSHILNLQHGAQNKVEMQESIPLKASPPPPVTYKATPPKAIQKPTGDQVLGHLSLTGSALIQVTTASDYLVE